MKRVTIVQRGTTVELVPREETAEERRLREADAEGTRVSAQARAAADAELARTEAAAAKEADIKTPTAEELRAARLAEISADPSPPRQVARVIGVNTVTGERIWAHHPESPEERYERERLEERARLAQAADQAAAPKPELAEPAPEPTPAERHAAHMAELRQEAARLTGAGGRPGAEHAPLTRFEFGHMLLRLLDAMEELGGMIEGHK